MKNNEEELLCDYFEEWVRQYKEGSVRDVTLIKWKEVAKKLREMAPELKLGDLDRREYQALLNKYAETHEKVTVEGFHHMLKAAVLDAVDEGIIQKNPTRKITIKGKAKKNKRKKYLSMGEAEELISVLNLEENEMNWDWMILLAIKTGMRFEELLGLTVENFDFQKLTISIEKTFDYKYTQEFAPTKNKTSVRTIKMDWKTAMQFQNLLKDKEPERRVFDFKERFYNSTVNDYLRRKCREARVPEMTMHCLRHTHASILMYKEVSMQSIAKRLGHASTDITQKVYVHVIKEMESKDEKKVMAALMELDY